MIRMRTILSLALLATTAACGGGGGGGGGGSPPAVSGATPAQSAATAPTPSTDFANPQVTMTSSGNVGYANGPTSQTVTDDGATLNVHVDGMPDMQFDMAKDVDNSTFTPDTGPWAQFTKTDADGNKITAIKFNDGSQLDATTFGIWQKFDTTGALVSSGAYASGTDTPADQMPTSGKATYAGNAIGTGQDGTGSFTLTGTSNVVADFGNRNVTTDISLNKGDQQFVALHSADGAIAANSNKFAGSIQGGGLNGGIQGAFFGTTANQRGAAGEVGGVFAASGGGTSVNGAFAAGKTP